MQTFTWILLGIDGLFIAALLLFALFLRYSVYSFLALNRPIEQANILVVEGWLEEHNLKATITEFERGGYQYLVTVGGALRVGARVSGHKTTADLAASTLKVLGFPSEKIVALPSPFTPQKRTETTAVTFQDWLMEKQLKIERINIFSNHIHARRTHFFYQQYLSPDIRVGVIASNPVDFDPKAWWRSSHGTKVVITEFIAYCHAICTTFFNKL
ncbi:MAG: hypothetical protein AB4042_07935 [Leptolyngbyaceae cyanobacterium]